MFETVKKALVGDDKVREAPYALKQLLAASEKTQPSESSRRVVEAFPLDVLAAACCKANKDLFAAEALAMRGETEYAKMAAEAEAEFAKVTADAQAKRDEIVDGGREELDGLVADVERKKQLLEKAQAKFLRQAVDMGALERCRDMHALLKDEAGK